LAPSATNHTDKESETDQNADDNQNDVSNHVLNDIDMLTVRNNQNEDTLVTRTVTKTVKIQDLAPFATNHADKESELTEMQMTTTFPVEMMAMPL